MSLQLAPEGFVWCGKKGDLTLYLIRAAARLT